MLHVVVGNVIAIEDIMLYCTYLWYYSRESRCWQTESEKRGEQREFDSRLFLKEAAVIHTQTNKQLINQFIAKQCDDDKQHYFTVLEECPLPLL